MRTDSKESYCGRSILDGFLPRWLRQILGDIPAYRGCDDKESIVARNNPLVKLNKGLEGIRAFMEARSKESNEILRELNNELKNWLTDQGAGSPLGRNRSTSQKRESSVMARDRRSSAKTDERKSSIAAGNLQEVEHNPTHSIDIRSKSRARTFPTQFYLLSSFSLNLC